MSGSLPKGVMVQTALDPVFSNYGFAIQKNVILDKECYQLEKRANEGGGAQKIWYAPTVAQENISQNHTITKKVKGMILLKSSSIEPVASVIASNKISYTQIVKSSKEAWTGGPGTILYPQYMTVPQASQLTQYTIAAVLEGSFPSYFAGKPAPLPDNAPKNQKMKTTGGDEFLSKAQNGKIVVVASADMAKNSIVDSEGTTPNAIFVRNIIDWAIGDSSLIPVRNKGLSYNPPRKTSESAKTFIKYLNIAGAPILVILIGIVLWRLDTVRRSRIRSKFQKK